MSRLSRSTDIRGALRLRQRGFLLNPFRFAGGGGGGSPTTITVGGRAGNTYSGMQDALLISDFPTNNYSAESSSQGYAFLLRPDLSALPAGCTITDAFWTLGVNSGAGDVQTINVRRLLRAWVEAQASHNNYSTGNAWTTAGAAGDGTDRISAVSCSMSYTGGYSTSDIVSTSNATLISDIQGIVGGATNNGWRFDGAVSLALPGHATAALRPFLTVTYTGP